MKPRARSALIGAGVGIGVYAISKHAFSSSLRGQVAVRVAPALVAIARGLSSPKRAGDGTNQILGVASMTALGIWFVRDGAAPAPSAETPTDLPPIHISSPQQPAQITQATTPGPGMPAWEQEMLRAEQDFAQNGWAAENAIDARVYPSMYHAIARYLYDIRLSPSIFADDVRGITAFPQNMREGIRTFQSQHQLRTTGYVNSSTYTRLKAVALPSESRL